MITIDSAEADYRKKMIERIAKRLDLPTEQKAAATDISYGSTLGLELKRPSDFISSIQDGRLFQQAKDLGQFERRAVLVEGTMPDLLQARGGMNVSSVLGAVYSLPLRMGVPVQFTSSAASGYFELHLDAAMRQGIENGIPGASLGRRKSSPSEMALSVLSSFPGVGWNRAQAILKKYGTLGAALHDIGEWHNVDGIGTKTVDNCLALLSHEHDPKVTS